MEGVVDGLMRSVLTSVNDFDLCIAEFVRVVDTLVPKHIFYKICPELHSNGNTSANTPVRVQLLGQNPTWMAENAIRAIELGSHGIDINFGCPAKAVNKSKGGAILLKTPEQIYKIVSTVKQAVGKDIDVSVKIRLGFEDSNLLDENVSAIVSANADLLTIHARTKTDGYRPPAYWDYIGKINNNFPIPIIANGEIWSNEDAQRCKLVTKTNHLMLGRGILALPNLANVIKFGHKPMSWLDMRTLLLNYCDLELLGDKSYYFSSRLKQWLRYLRLQYPQAETLFQLVKPLKNKQEILTLLNRQ